MPLIVRSPYSGKPVKIRDQDVERAIRDEAGRVFYVVPTEDGQSHYGSPTRRGSAKDEASYAALVAKMEAAGDQADKAEAVNGSMNEVDGVTGAQGSEVHDATGKPRRSPAVLIGVVIILLGALAAGGYGWQAGWFDAVLSETETDHGLPEIEQIEQIEQADQIESVEPDSVPTPELP